MSSLLFRFASLLPWLRRGAAGVLVALGFAAAGSANAAIDQSPIARVDEIRRRLLEADALMDAESSKETEANRQHLVQRWGNWPNWPNWMNWRNWRNW